MSRRINVSYLFLIVAGGSLRQFQGWQEPGNCPEEVLPSGGELLQAVPQ